MAPLLSSPVLTAAGAAFAASLVEMVEAFTIVLAVAVTRGWRTAGAGTAAALGLLAVAIAVLGPALSTIPLTSLRLVLGMLLLLFGLGWLRKAVLRAGGVLALRDEQANFVAAQSRLAAGPSSSAGSAGGVHAGGAATAFQAVLLEGVEVVFIVVAVGAGPGLLAPAMGGAAAALGLVLVVGALLHRPLARVPENSLKFAVGVMLTGFGLFWTGEGLGVPWPGADLALVYLAALALGTALALVARLRASAPGALA